MEILFQAAVDEDRPVFRALFAEVIHGACALTGRGHGLGFGFDGGATAIGNSVSASRMRDLSISSTSVCVSEAIRLAFSVSGGQRTATHPR